MTDKKVGFLKKLNKIFINLAKSRYAIVALAFVAFFDAILFPITPIVLLIPMCLARKDLYLFYALIVSTGSFIGSLITYILSYHFWNPYILSIVTSLNIEEQINYISTIFANEWGAFVPLMGSFLPVNYNLISSMCGMMSANAENLNEISASAGFTSFAIFCALGRFSRFILECYLIVKIENGSSRIFIFIRRKFKSIKEEI